MGLNSEDKLVFGSRCGGIGDNLVFTPLMKYFTNTTLELLDHPKSRNVAQLFDGLCSVNFSDNPTGVSESAHPHSAQKKIEGYGIQDVVNCIPKIKLHQHEIDEARKKLSEFRNPIVFVSDNNGSGNSRDFHAKYRIPEKDTLQLEVDRLSQNHSVLQFGLSNNFTKLNGTTEILDLPLRDLAAYYSVIGKYFGVDTGDYHLMLAVGGECEVVCPKSSSGYNHLCWHYSEHLWRNEPCRVKYNIY